MHLGRILYHHHVLALYAAKAQLGNRRRRVGKQARLVFRIDPGTGHHLGAVLGPNIMFIKFDDSV